MFCKPLQVILVWSLHILILYTILKPNNVIQTILMVGTIAIAFSTPGAVVLTKAKGLIKEYEIIKKISKVSLMQSILPFHIFRLRCWCRHFCHFISLYLQRMLSLIFKTTSFKLKALSSSWIFKLYLCCWI